MPPSRGELRVQRRGASTVLRSSAWGFRLKASGLGFKAQGLGFRA